MDESTNQSNVKEILKLVLNSGKQEIIIIDIHAGKANRIRL